ncbi:MAG: creatininase family protein [Pseudomonadota bacterium]
MLLHLSTWREVEDYLQRSKAILIPIGSTEQHGPNGFLGTDALCPEIISHAAADTAEMLVGPTFNVGCAQHHLAFAGSMTLRPSTMIAAMEDWTASLQRHGFERVYWLNGHGGNIATINAAFAEIYAHRSFEKPGGTAKADLRLKLKNWWELSGVIELCQRLYPTGHGSHATPSEVAVTYYAYPEAVKTAEMTPQIAPNAAFRDAEHYRSVFADGRIGSDPSLATPEDGGRIVEAAAAALAEDFERFSKTA